MATSGKKRKREIQDENKDFADNFEYLRYLSEQKRRRVDAKTQAYAFKVIIHWIIYLSVV